MPINKRCITQKRVAVFVPSEGVVSETFIRAHINELPFDILPHYGWGLGVVDEKGRAVLYKGKWIELLTNRFWPRLNFWIRNLIIANYLQTKKIDAVLAEYGTMGGTLAAACLRAKVPLFVHFHGYDASINDVLDSNSESYRKMFKTAAGVIAVSKAMESKLIQLGAERERLYLNVYGVDPIKFTGGSPELQPPNFLGVGRFVEKKAPYLTVLAFSYVVKIVNNSTLTLVGDGPMLGACKRLAKALGVLDSITFTGALDSNQVQSLIRCTRVFVQHSLVAENGDSEGTPLAVIEAQMTGIPVVATRHAGIPDVVIDGLTGFLVDEGDADMMAMQMLQFAKDPKLAGRMGRAARERALCHFSLKRHIDDITNMINKNLSN